MHIKNAHATNPEMLWPPSATYLLNRALPPPDCLKDFLSNVINGKTYSNLSSNKDKVATSIAEDICYATTNGQWKTSKHLLPANTLHHLSGSAQLISIVNRLGQDEAANYRPITMTLRVTRIFHKVLALRLTGAALINPRQKAFVPVDGCADNIFLLDSIIRGA